MQIDGFLVQEFGAFPGNPYVKYGELKSLLDTIIVYRDNDEPYVSWYFYIE